jgi:hypothetical protein
MKSQVPKCPAGTGGGRIPTLSRDELSAGFLEVLCRDYGVQPAPVMTFRAAP